jgi:proteic killer suppression protein
MDVDFADEGFERLAVNASAMNRKLGAACARKLRVRLAALYAVDSAADLLTLPGRWHPLSADWKDHLSADLDHPRRLLVRPRGDAPLSDGGGVDWAAVVAVTVVGTVDTH